MCTYSTSTFGNMLSVLLPVADGYLAGKPCSTMLIHLAEKTVGKPVITLETYLEFSGVGLGHASVGEGVYYWNRGSL